MFNRRLKFSQFCILAVVFATTACNSSTTIKVDPLNDQQIALQEGREVHLTISKMQYKEALRTVDPFKVRVVPILKSQSFAASAPEYRLFEIAPGSAYAVLGLQNTDVLLTAEDYPLIEAERFPLYMKYLQGQSKAKIRIRRGDEPLVFLIDFTD